MKKRILPWMHCLVKSNYSQGFLLTLDDAWNPHSKLLRYFRTEEDLRHWVAQKVGGTLSHNHVIDNTGLGLVPDTWDETFVQITPSISNPF